MKKWILIVIEALGYPVVLVALMSFSYSSRGSSSYYYKTEYIFLAALGVFMIALSRLIRKKIKEG